MKNDLITIAARMRLDRFINTPVALWPGYVESFVSALHDDASVFDAVADEDAPKARDYDLIRGVAVVPIQGVLVHERSWFDETAYSSIASQMMMAMEDNDARAIALHIKSPGGEVGGMFDLADAIYSSRGDKPIWAIVDDYAYSAAYALASSADKIVVTRTGGTGSVGVISMHVDVTKALENMGIKVTTLTYGAHKADSQPTTPLSDEARDRFQADVDTLGEMFVAMVARNRGMSVASVRKTEAGVFLGSAGIEAGFADAMMSPVAAFLKLAAKANS
jgi:signal peptide peptidase SppA